MRMLTGGFIQHVIGMFAAIIAFYGVACGAVSVDIRDETGDGQKDIVIDNGFFCATLEPACGGNLTRFVFNGQEFAKRSDSRADGFFKALISPWDWGSDFYNAPAAYRFIVRSPEEVVIAFESAGTEGDQKFLELTKIYTIRGDECGIRVDLALHNQVRSQTEIRAGFRLHHNLVAPGTELNFFLPKHEGTLSVTATEHDGTNAGVWNRYPSRGWTGCADAAARVGLAFVCNEVFLDKGLCWFAGRPDCGSVEHFLHRMPIAAGDTWKTSVHLVPFIGLDRVDGAGACGAGALRTKIKADGTAVEVCVVSTFSGTINMTSRVVDPDDTDTDLARLGTLHVETTAGQPASRTFDIPTAGRNGILVCDVDAGDRGVFRLERRIGTDANSPYKMIRLADPYIPPQEDVYVPTVRRDLKTSDRVWVDALPGDPLCASYILPIDHQRQMVELAQRFGVDYLAAPVGNYKMFNFVHQFGLPPGQIAPDKKRAVKMLAEHLDLPTSVLVIGDCFHGRYKRHEWTWQELPESIRKRILDKVAMGCGLVYISPTELDDEATSAFLGDPITLNHELLDWMPPGLIVEPEQVRVKQYGKGRVVILKLASLGLLPYKQCFFHPEPAHQLDYWYAFLTRAMMWAARHEPTVRLGTLTREGEIFRASVQGEARAMRVDYELRDAYGVQLDCGSVPVDGNRVALPVIVPRIGGRYYLHAFTRLGNVTHDWRVETINVTVPMRLTAVHTVTSPMPGKPAIVRVATEGAADGAKLELLLRSIAGDLYASWMFDTKPEAWDLALNVPAMPGLTARLEARLIAAGRTLDRKIVILNLPNNARRQLDRYYALVWGAGAGATDYESAAFGCRQLQRMGFRMNLSSMATYHQAGWEIAQMFLDTGMTPMLQNLSRHAVHDHGIPFRYQQTGDIKQLWRNPCLSSEAYRSNMCERIRTETEKTKPLGFRVYHWGDECSYTYEGGMTPLDICFHPDTLCEFRDWLKTQYADLAALNVEWQTGFAQWGDVMPMTFEQVKGRNSFAPWVDHRLFSDYLYCILTMKRFGDEIRKYIPDAIVGEGGITCQPLAYGGFNWPLKMQANTHTIPYGYPEILTQLAPNYPDFRFSTPWTGYTAPIVSSQYSIWRYLLMGASNTSYWYYRHLLDPDLQLSAQGIMMKTLLAELNGGVADLLVSGERQYDPVGILYSQPSVLGAYVMDGHGADTYALYRSNLLAWIMAFFDAGIQPILVTEETLDNYGLRALVLPMAIGLSPDGAAKIRSLVEGGGVLIADVLPGVMSAHGRPLAKGHLDDLFGIRRSGSARVLRKQVRMRMRLPELALDDVILDSTLVENGLTAEDAKSHGVLANEPTHVGNLVFSYGGDAAADVAFYHRVGKGHTLYLGALPAALNDRANGRNVLIDLMAKVGVSYGFELLTEDGAPPKGVTVNRYKLGPVTFIGLEEPPENIPNARLHQMHLADLEKHTRTFALHVPDISHFYDVRHHKPLGSGREVHFETVIGTGNIVAVSPFAIGDVVLDNPVLMVRPGQTVTLTGHLAGAHRLHSFVHLRFDTGDADRDLILSSLTEVRDGRFKHTFMIPLDMRGMWRVIVIEAITGHSDEVRIEMARRK